MCISCYLSENSHSVKLTLNIQFWTKKKKLKFLFLHLFVVPQGFMKAFKALIKPFETPQKSVKIKIYFLFQYNFLKGREG